MAPFLLPHPPEYQGQISMPLRPTLLDRADGVVVGDSNSRLVHRSAITARPSLRCEFNDLFGCVGAILIHGS
jgi:hypothetical protein